MSGDAKNVRLAALLAADIVGYSSLMEADEAGAFDSVKSLREDLVDPLTKLHGGRVFKSTGDGFLAEFHSVVDAVQFASELQNKLASRPSDKPLQLRCGINLGDVIVDNDDLFGDGVNVAARLEQICEPGGIMVSAPVYEAVARKVDLAFEDIGEQQLKNISRPIRVYKALIGKAGAPRPTDTHQPRRSPLSNPVAMIAVAALIAIAGLFGLYQTEYFVAPTQKTPPPVANVPPADKSKPSIIVLPFNNLSGDPSQNYFSDGITEDLTTDISRISGLLVIARNTAFQYAGKAVDIRQLGRDLGVSYALEGSVRKAGDRVRINAQLIDAKSGNHLWAERFDRKIENVFTLQDEITRKIVSALTVKLTSSEDTALSQSKRVNAEAYDNFLKGLERFRRFTPTTNKEARDFFQKAIDLDPNFARAWADIGLSHGIDLLFNWTKNPEESIAQATRYSDRALAIDPRVREVQFAMSTVYLSQKKLDQAIDATNRALLIDPSYADAYAQRAQSQAFNGQWRDGLVSLESAKRLNPLYPFYYTWIESLANFVGGNYEKAINISQNVASRNPEFTGARLILAASYANTGKIDLASWEVDEILAALPHFTLEAARKQAPFARQSDLDRYLDGLKKAGLK